MELLSAHGVDKSLAGFKSFSIIVSCPEREEFNRHHPHHLKEFASVHLVLLAFISVKGDHLKYELGT